MGIKLFSKNNRNIEILTILIFMIKVEENRSNAKSPSYIQTKVRYAKSC